MLVLAASMGVSFELNYSPCVASPSLIGGFCSAFLAFKYVCDGIQNGSDRPNLIVSSGSSTFQNVRAHGDLQSMLAEMTSVSLADAQSILSASPARVISKGLQRETTAAVFNPFSADASSSIKIGFSRNRKGRAAEPPGETKDFLKLS